MVSRAEITLRKAVFEAPLEAARLILRSEGLGLNDPLTEEQERYLSAHTIIGSCEFEAGNVHDGPLWGWPQFSLGYLSLPEGYYDEHLNELLNTGKITALEQSGMLLHSPVQTLNMDLLRPSEDIPTREPVRVYFTPDGQVVAARNADINLSLAGAGMIHDDQNDSAVLQRVRAVAGEDAVHVLTGDECDRLAHAIVITPSTPEMLEDEQ